MIMIDLKPHTQKLINMATRSKIIYNGAMQKRDAARKVLPNSCKWLRDDLRLKIELMAEETSGRSGQLSGTKALL